MIYGYARVSTIAQCKNGNSLEEQNEALTAYGCNEIITETYTGKTTERPQFNELLKRLHSGDTLVVTKLDRFARTVIEGVLTVRTLFERGVKVHILNIFEKVYEIVQQGGVIAVFSNPIPTVCTVYGVICTIKLFFISTIRYRIKLHLNSVRYPYGFITELFLKLLTLISNFSSKLVLYRLPVKYSGVFQ